MKLSCVLFAHLALVGLVPGALALDATTRPLHHTKAARLVQPRKAVKHGATGATAPHAAVANTPRSAKGAPTVRRARLGVHRHRYYERFSASSFAAGNIFADDITTGEDPVVRQAAIDA